MNRYTRILNPGESVVINVYANTHWNYTGLFFQKDQSYKFSASGEWMDAKDACDWKGTQDEKFTPGDIVRMASSIWGEFETLFKKIGKNEATDFVITKRVEEFKWFVMVGAIANDGGGEGKLAVKNDGSPTPHQYVDLTQYENSALKVKKSGYLYCFPNDVWSLYGNNSGSVQLTITRIS